MKSDGDAITLKYNIVKQYHILVNYLR